MSAVHHKQIINALKPLGLACRASLSGRSLVIYRPSSYRWGINEIVLGTVRLENHCVERRIVEGIVGAAGYRIRIGRF